MFVHFVAKDGFVQAQHDSQPVFGYYPTSSWKPGEVVGDLHCIYLPESLRDDEYFLRIGLYDPEDGQRFAIQNESETVNALDLLPISVFKAD